MPKLSGVEVNLPAFVDKQETWIDKRGMAKRIPMRILCLGLNRTATSSLRVALHELGYSTYHGWSMMENPPDCFLWDEALAAKFEGKGRPYGRKEFDSIFYDTDACLDIPTSVFPKELIEAYPDAKVIVTMRDFDAWYKSMMTTVVPDAHGVDDFMPWALRKLDKAVGIYIPTMKTCFDNKYGEAFKHPDPSAAKAIYTEHVEIIRSLTGRDKQKHLEFDVKQGWSPLCEFLGKDVPRDESGNARPFPRVNDAISYHEVFEHLFKAIMLKRVQEWALRIAAVGVLGYSAWWTSNNYSVLR